MKLLLSILAFGCLFVSERIIAQVPTKAMKVKTLTVPVKGPKQKPVTVMAAGSPKQSTPSLPLPVGEYTDGNWLIQTESASRAVLAATKVDRRGYKIAEAYDFNRDGFMDNWYTYDDGVLVREEIDTNFDHKIDLWVYLYDAVYIRAYERDRNFDGIIDQTKIY